VVDIVLTDAGQRPAACRAIPDADLGQGDRNLRVSVPAGDALHALSRVSLALSDAGIGVRDVGLRRPTLDDVFLQLTGGDTGSTSVSDHPAPQAKEGAT
jgi:ABC-2 type transport system ATP-binding protein